MSLADELEKLAEEESYRALTEKVIIHLDTILSALRERDVAQGAGICAWDLDECTVTLALDTPEQVRAMRKMLPGKNRVRVCNEAGQHMKGEGE